MSQEETPEGAPQDAPDDALQTEQAIAVAADVALDRTVDDLADADLKLVIALQKAELDRLLRENAQLHARVEQLVSLQEREQILRQQLQNLLGGDRQAPQLLPARRSEAGLQAANHRNTRLKEALNLLLDALERRQQR